MKARKLLSFILVMCFSVTIMTVGISTATFAAGTTTINVDLATQGNAMTALSESLDSFAYRLDWMTSYSTDYFSQNYPAIKRVELYAPTGGGYSAKAQSICYVVTSMTSTTITALFQTSHEPISDFTFWVMDPSNWQWLQLSNWTKTDTLIASGQWTRRVYTLNSIPEGVTMFTVDFPEGGLNCYNPQLGKVVINAQTSITDEINDWSKINGHTSNLSFDTQNSEILEDTSRLMRTNNVNTTDFTPCESILYHYSDITSFEATGLFGTDNENIADFKFFSSSDNSTWTQQTGWTKVDTLINNNTWTKRVYTKSTLPSGTNYIKVCFPTAGANSWNPQLGKVIITAGSAITDNLNDWTVSSYHTSGLAFDTSNADALQDSSRAMRTNKLYGWPIKGYDRDLFKNPQDRNVLDDYDFTSLMTACHNIVDQGLKPRLRLGHVPCKFSYAPDDGGYGYNNRPPDDYNVYYNYIKAIIDALKTEFGTNEVNTWSWGVMVEIEGGQFEEYDGTGASTKIAFFKVYDYTVAALQDSLGASNVNVGVHCMNQVDGLWDNGEFIDHCASGTNYKTQATGTQLNYIDFSYYEAQPGNTGELEYMTSCGALGLCQSIDKVRDRAILAGLTNLKYCVGEGGIGYDLEYRFIINNAVGDSYEGSFDALKFKKMNDLGISSFTSWGLNTEVIWGGVPGVSQHINNLANKMVGEVRVDAFKSGDPVDSNDIVDAVASFNSSNNSVHVMAFNHNPSFTVTGSEDLTLTIKNISPVSGNTVTVKKWIVDDTHANFWPTWVTDRTNQGVSETTVANYSPHSLTVPATLSVKGDKDYWYTRVPTYQTLAALSYTTTTPTVSDDTLTLTETIAQHGVVFYEITNAKLATTPTSPPKAITDNLDNWRVCISHSKELVFDTSNPGPLEDSSRAYRTTTSGLQNAIYYALGMDSIIVTGLFGTDLETIDNFKFYTSPDRGTWTQQTSWTNVDTPINNGNWTKRVYTLSSIPSGTNYVKVEFPTGGLHSWNPQLGKVEVTY